MDIAVAIKAGMAAYAGATRRRIPLATVLIRLPSGYRPGRRRTRHTHFLEKALT